MASPRSQQGVTPSLRTGATPQPDPFESFTLALGDQGMTSAVKGVLVSSALDSTIPTEKTDMADDPTTWDDETKYDGKAVPRDENSPLPEKTEPPEREKICFCIMPVTVPPERLEEYSAGKHHFRQVFETLFEPAAEKVGLRAVFPDFGVSTPIPLEIIQQLDRADLCIGDISTLNPNVFVEIGIRVALNRPLCLVRDETVDKIPFDTGTIGHWRYNSELRAYNVQKELPKLIAFMEDTMKKHEEGISYWSVFGMTATAQPLGQMGGTQDQMLKYLVRTVGDIARQRPVHGGFGFSGASEENNWVSEWKKHGTMAVPSRSISTWRQLLFGVPGHTGTKAATLTRQQAGDLIGDRAATMGMKVRSVSFSRTPVADAKPIVVHIDPQGADMAQFDGYRGDLEDIGLLDLVHFDLLSPIRSLGAGPYDDDEDSPTNDEKKE